MNVKRKLAIIFGGESSEHEASLKMFEWMYSQIQSQKLDKGLVFRYVIFVSRDGRAVLLDADLSKNYLYYSQQTNLAPFIKVIEQIKRKNLFVYSVLQGQNAEDGKIQGVAEFLKIDGIFGGLLSCAISMSKYHLNQYIGANFKFFNIPKTISLTSIENIRGKLKIFANKEIVIKPNALGASIFAKKITCTDRNLDEIKSQAEKIFEYDTRVLIQEYIAGEEHACGCIEKDGSVHVLPLMKIQTKSGFFGHDEKHKAGLNREILIDPGEETEQLKEIKKTCKKIFLDLDFQNMCRFDLIIKGKKVYFLEINSFPGLMKKSLLTQMLRSKNLSVIDLVNYCYKNFLRRDHKKTILKYTIE